MRENFRGAVSLFIVIFTTLLITVITVSFVRIMVTGQQEATSSDLSQSAYDSAQAGVEDAKRAILHYVKAGYDGKTDINSTKCNEAVVAYAGVTEKSGRVAVGDNANQYYTCVKITMNTSDYEGYLSKNSSKIIPLVGESEFDTVQIQWYTNENLGSEKLSQNTDANYPLFSEWNLSSPSIMRTQFIQFGENFQLGDFDTAAHASTMFLYPKSNPSVADPSTDEVINKLSLNPSRAQSMSPSRVNCFSPTASKTSGYSCTARITGISGGSSLSAFLNLTALYNDANYRITLYSGETPVKFNGVQPEIDSTGLADDLLRRVKVRVETVNSSFIYPEAAVDTTSSLCKNFMVTNSSYKALYDTDTSCSDN